MRVYICQKMQYLLAQVFSRCMVRGGRQWTQKRVTMETMGGPVADDTLIPTYYTLILQDNPFPQEL